MTAAKLHLVVTTPQAQVRQTSSLLSACTCGVLRGSLCITCRRWGRHYRAVTERRSQHLKPGGI